MLNPIEQRLRAALAARLGPEVALSAGPAPPPAAGTDRLVVIAAVALDQSADPEGEDRREPAFHEDLHTLTTAGGAIDLALPDPVGDLVEVETPPGFLARPGDAWWVDQGRLHFYQAPAGPVTLRIRRGPARGYRETLPCRVLLHLDAWSPTAAQTDALLLPALGAVLGGLLGLDLIELGRDAGTGFEARLLRPRVQPAGIERALMETAGGTAVRGRIVLHLRGELELTLALGAPPAAGVIESIDYRYRQK